MQPNSYQPNQILIVDDETALIFFLKQTLREAVPDCEIDVASSGEDALAKLTYSPYHLLITDLKMPGISGFTLIELARSIHPKIKVILMTAFNSADIYKGATELAVDGYLTKPFSTAKLGVMTQKILATP